MSPANTIALLINALTISLAFFMLILLLWQDSRNADNLAFGLLLFMLVLWSSGTLLARTVAYIGGADIVIQFGTRLLEVGFTGSSIGLYLFTIVLSGGRGRSFIYSTSLAMVLLLIYQSWLIFSSSTPSFEVRPDGSLRYAFNAMGLMLYASLMFAVIMVAWQRRRKILSGSLLLGIFGFSAGIIIELMSSELRSKSIGLDVSAVSALILSYSLVRLQIIEPLRGRANQLRAVRDVGLAITSQVRLEEVLSTIAGQAAGILQADGAAIFMNRGAMLELAAVHNMPVAFRGYTLTLGEGLAGQVAATQNATRLEDYRHDWQGQPDMPFAKQAFGAVIAAPLVFAEEVMGVLFIIEGTQGKRFDKEDMQLLDLLGPQAAVAIKNSRLFEDQRTLATELAAAKDTLETVLTSTENPVIAIDRRFKVIFANPAADRLFGKDERSDELLPDELLSGELLSTQHLSGKQLFNVVPPDLFPHNPRYVLRKLRRDRVYTYELTFGEKTYQCNLGLLGAPIPQGFVIVLNDVSQLKQIDNLKNRMIQMTSHDLKNPLTAAMTHIELLEEEGEDILTEQMSADIATVWTQLERMERIITNILDLEKIQSGTLTQEECDLLEMIGVILHDLKGQAERKGVTLNVTLPDDIPVVMGNRHHLTQAINNVIDNAIKYTHSGGSVSISMQEAANEVIIRVADTGIGIPPEDRPRIFIEQFFRASTPAMDGIRGSGLGLSLVKAVVDAHQGRVWLESELNVGTVVYIALPIRRTMLELTS